MIEIKLTDTDALEYLEHKDTNLGYEQLLAKYKILQENTKLLGQRYVDLQAKYNALTSQENVSARVINDTEKAKNLTPDFAKPTNSQNTTPTRSNRKWSDMELSIIKYAISRPETENNRQFATLAKKLNRSKNAIRTKLAELDIYVEKGIIYPKAQFNQ